MLIFDHFLLHLAAVPQVCDGVHFLVSVWLMLACVCVSAAFFMEHWKRRQMRLNYEWDLTGFEDEEVWSHDHTHTVTWSLQLISLVCHLMLLSSSSPGVCVCVCAGSAEGLNIKIWITFILHSQLSSPVFHRVSSMRFLTVLKDLRNTHLKKSFFLSFFLSQCFVSVFPYLLSFVYIRITHEPNMNSESCKKCWRKTTNHRRWFCCECVFLSNSFEAICVVADNVCKCIYYLNYLIVIDWLNIYNLRITRLK